jgi:SpoVK/Ycf46/Vps4 family AAA+-type ATPase
VVGQITNREDCVPDLVEMGVLKKVAHCKLEDYFGEYHYLGAMLRSHHKFWGEHHFPPPSVQMLRSLLIEHCVLPLAQTEIRQKAPESLCARSLLLYGPKGSGKSMLARAIAAETGATFFDLSPVVIEGKSTQGKTGSAMLVYKTFCCAQDMAPSVIYLDQVEQVYQANKKGKKGGDPNAPSRIKKDLSAAIKQVKRGPEATDQDRILFIGCTSRPFDDLIDMKELMNAFDEKVWVSFPEYGSRVVLWKKFMEQHGVVVDPTVLNVSTLARVSDGYSAGSIKQTVDRVLTARRVQQLRMRQLKVQEFIGPLSRTAFCWIEDYKKFSDFDFEATGEKAYFDRRALEEEAAAAEAAGKKGKK